MMDLMICLFFYHCLSVFVAQYVGILFLEGLASRNQDLFQEERPQKRTRKGPWQRQCSLIFPCL